MINRSAGVDGDAENSGAREATIYIHQTCYLLALLASASKLHSVRLGGPLYMAQMLSL